MIGKHVVIGIVGARSRDSLPLHRKVRATFLAVQERLSVPVVICSGGAKKGADAAAKGIHENLAIPYLEFPADWNGPHKKAAGFHRNTFIAEASDILIAAPGTGNGTYDTIDKFLMHNCLDKETAIGLGKLVLI